MKVTGQYLSSLEIILASCVSASLSEFLSWLLIYRTEPYKKLKRSIDQTSRKVERKKEVESHYLGSHGYIVTCGSHVLLQVTGTIQTDRKKSAEKKISKAEDNLKAMNQAMMLVKMKSTVAVGITMLSIFSAISAAYDGQVKRARLFCAHARVTLTIHVCVQEVARLPFEPVFFAQVFTRRGLDDNHDVRACSMLFLYMISSMVPPLIPPAHTDFTTHLAPKFPPHYSRATYSLRLAHVSSLFGVNRSWQAIRANLQKFLGSVTN
jgi:hypothetical protein